MQKLLITAFITLLSIGCTRNDEILLNVYECKEKNIPNVSLDLLNCTDTCKRFTFDVENTQFAFFGFTVDKDGSKVLHRTYVNKELGESTVYENCKIFDNKNWDCSSEKKSLGVDTINIIKMNKGIFMNLQTSKYFIAKSMLIKEEVNVSVCGK